MEKYYYYKPVSTRDIHMPSKKILYQMDSPLYSEPRELSESDKSRVINKDSIDSLLPSMVSRGIKTSFIVKHVVYRCIFIDICIH